MSDTSVKAFIGTEERTLCLTPPMIAELEKLTGFGIGSIFARAADLVFTHREIIETVRLALIGGGMSDRDALGLVDTYVRTKPIHEVRPIAWATLRALWFGATAEQPEEVA